LIIGAETAVLGADGRRHTDGLRAGPREPCDHEPRDSLHAPCRSDLVRRFRTWWPFSIVAVAGLLMRVGRNRSAHAPRIPSLEHRRRVPAAPDPPPRRCASDLCRTVSCRCVTFSCWRSRSGACSRRRGWRIRGSGGVA